MMISHKDVFGVYCAGGIKKGQADAGKVSWGEAAREALSRECQHQLVFLSPEHRTDDISNSLTVFGRDHFQISVSDFVVVDATQRRGLGVGIEIVSAKYFEKPVICVTPDVGHYRRPALSYLGADVTDYVHPHLEGLSDAIVEDFGSAGRWISEFIISPRPVKTIGAITDAISRYKQLQLISDSPMRKALMELGQIES